MAMGFSMGIGDFGKFVRVENLTTGRKLASSNSMLADYMHGKDSCGVTSGMEKGYA